MDTFGWILVETGNELRGLELLREAHARASRRPSIRYHLAVVLSRLGHTKEAREHLNAIVNDKKAGDFAVKAERLIKKL